MTTGVVRVPTLLFSRATLGSCAIENGTEVVASGAGSKFVVILENGGLDTSGLRPRTDQDPTTSSLKDFFVHPKHNMVSKLSVHDTIPLVCGASPHPPRPSRWFLASGHKRP